MMKTVINSEVVVAYFHCPRKAFLLLCSEDKKEPHEYVRIIENRANTNRVMYLNLLKRDNIDVSDYDPDNVKKDNDFLIEATLNTHDLESYCDVLTRVGSRQSFGKDIYEPTIVVGTHTITKEQKIELAFVGHVLGQVQNKLPVIGTIIGADQQDHRVKLENIYKELRPIIKTLKEWITTSLSEPPPVILNRQCPYCQFRNDCREKAETDNDLSLLDRMTPKLIRRYHKKGIFTVNQLSYLFKPRRSRKRTKKPVVHFNPELQALAIRTGKIYLQELPELPRHGVELFFDIEGIPDQNFDYLMGLLVCNNENNTYQSFWANTIQDEERIWGELLEKANEYPEAPIYHYGNYELKTLNRLEKKYQRNCESFKNRLVNITSFIYGRVYFPVRSNKLKELGKFVGASWTSPEASGLQSLVWRELWEENQHDRYKQMLIKYNEEDCRALQLLTNQLSKIKDAADSDLNIDFADRPKQNTTEIGGEIHWELEQILKSAHADYTKKRILIRPNKSNEPPEKKKMGPPIGHPGHCRKATKKSGNIVHVPMQRECPNHNGKFLKISKNLSEKTITDLHFTKNGYKKIVITYTGQKGFCSKCGKYYVPPRIQELSSQHFGHAFKAWAIYQRIILRLPYHIITQVMEELIGEITCESTILKFMTQFAVYYTPTEEIHVQRILKSPFIHVDETKINIRGNNQYVWVFTDGKYVVLKKTETREATFVNEFLSNYDGVLISDFYPGYDSVPCKQQKCWVHLIRDLNDDLWDAPFNAELESFVLEVRNLIVPIFEAVDKHGLKTKYLNKFKKSVEQFYDKNIVDKDYKSELTKKYQKRFQRYKNSLFTFLEQDNIPWNNNMAERALRQLAVQRKISTHFFENTVPDYLLLLGIAQTCRFQDKSFLKFLLSEEIDIDKIRVIKHLKISSKGNVKNQNCKIGNPESDF
ncbi:MAG: IS66 family transposase [Methanoregula sp.]|nr:IS66 family transposase [Methanoregula sp.]